MREHDEIEQQSFPEKTEIQQGPVRAQLERIVRSRMFRAAPRCAEFLSFVVDQKLNGRSFAICAEAIRQTLYPTSQGHDPEAPVRATAGRLRNLLHRYYKLDGLADLIRITIPINTYEPEFSTPSKPAIVIVPGHRHVSDDVDLFPKSEEAFALYCQGRRLWSERRPDRLIEAVTCFEAAIRDESKTSDLPYAAAYSALADCYTFLFVTGARHADVYYKALGAATAGVTYASTSADAHSALGAVRAVFERDWSGAETHFLRALELDPDCLNAYGWYSGHLACLGRAEEALVHAKRAMKRDPVSVFTGAHAAKVLYFCRQYNEAESLLLSLAETAPDNFLVRDLLGMTYAALNRYDSALIQLQTACKLSGGSSIAVASLGNLYGRMGQVKQAEEVLDTLERRALEQYIPQSQVAQVWLGLGDTDRALGCLQLAFEHRDFFLTVLHGWEPFDSVRHDVRFHTLLRQLKLPVDDFDNSTRYVTSR